jgi:aromatase
VAGHTETEIVIAAPRDFVFDVTNDLDAWTEMFTEYSSVEILERGPAHFVFRLTTKPDEEGTIRSWISRRDLYRDEWRIEARRLEPLTPFAEMLIRWTYESQDGRTLMRWQQDFIVAPGVAFSESDAEAYITANSEQQMAAIRRYVEAAWSRRR